MTGQPPPPRLARLLVTMAVRDPVREFLLGDLDEQFAATAAAVGVRRASRRYWSQAIRSAWSARYLDPATRTRAESRSIDMSGWWRDIRLGARTASRSPGYTAVTVTTLALAIGANTLLFSIANPLILRPLPVADAETLGWIQASNPERRIPRSGASVPAFLEWRDAMTSFQSLAAYELRSATLTGHGDARRIETCRMTTNLLEVWGIAPQRGRLLHPGEDAVGRMPVGILSYRFWREAFQADESVLGRTFSLDGKPMTIVGVLPASIEIGNLSFIDIWTPLPLDPASPRDRRTLRVVGRLASGATLERADAELQTIAAAQAQSHKTTNAGWQVRVRSTKAALASDDTWVILGLLAVVVVFVLLIACANLANLVLARIVARLHDQAIRLALGASRWQLVRPLLAESLCLGLVGGLIGFGLAYSGLRVIRAAATEPYLQSMVVIDRNVLIFNLALALITPLLFTLWPAISAGRSVKADSLHGVRTSSGRLTSRRRNVLIGSQVALALSLLVVSALVVQSMLYLRRMDLGLDVPKLLTYEFDLPDERYRTATVRSAFVEQVQAELASLPGSTGAGIASHLPALDADVVRPISGTLHDGDREENRPWVSWYAASPGFLEAAGIDLVRGRTFSAADTADGAGVVIINQLAAERYFDRIDAALGRVITIHDATAADRRATIVGVVEDTRNVLGVASPQLYVPIAQWPRASVKALVRSDDPSARGRDVRNVMRTLDPMVAISELKTLNQVVDSELGSWGIITGLFIGFAVLALALAAAGLFGVISYSVGQRRREIGIRLALGASPTRIGRMIVSEGLKVVGISVVIGLVLAMFLARASASLLFGITAGDPATFAGVVLVILVVALAASWSPANRAMRVDPAKTLRAE